MIMFMNEINGKGFAVGAIVWFALIFYAAQQGECVRYGSCGSEDLIIFSVISMGLLAPAYILARLTSDIFESK
jgi:hypothetical protein